MNVCSKEVVDGLFLVAGIGLREDCLHNRIIVAGKIT